MTSRRLRLPRLFRWASITAVLLLLLPATSFASHFELSRLASQIELVSGQIAHDLRYTRHYGPVRQRAVTLSREASQLVDTLRRNRSDSRVRSKFKDVRRGYERLEQAYFTADRRSHDPGVYRDISLLSDLFTNLSDEYYYVGFGAQNYRPTVVLNNRSIVINGSRFYNDRNGYRGDRGSRPSGRIVPHRERDIPQVFRGNSGNNDRVRPGRERQGALSGRGRIESGSRSIQSAPNYDHRSPVLERQRRQDAERRQIENRARQNHSPAAGRQSRQENRGQHTSSARGAGSETGRRNHYE